MPFSHKTITRLCTVLLILLCTTTLHAQHMLGKHIKDAIIKLGTEYKRIDNGPLTVLRYEPRMVTHPDYGKFKEYDEYEFLDGVCEARHAYMPLNLLQPFIEDMNQQFGHGDHLWRGTDQTYIAIREHDTNFELMVWTSTYEAWKNNR